MSAETERIALLEDLLTKACRGLDYSSRNDELRKEIAAAMPTSDLRLHAATGRGDTYCTLDITQIVRRPKLADHIYNATCIDCLQKWIIEYRSRAAELDRAVLSALDQLAKVEAA